MPKSNIITDLSINNDYFDIDEELKKELENETRSETRSEIGSCEFNICDEFDIYDEFSEFSENKNENKDKDICKKIEENSAAIENCAETVEKILNEVEILRYDNEKINKKLDKIMELIRSGAKCGCKQGN